MLLLFSARINVYSILFKVGAKTLLASVLFFFCEKQFFILFCIEDNTVFAPITILPPSGMTNRDTLIRGGKSAIIYCCCDNYSFNLWTFYFVPRLHNIIVLNHMVSVRCIFQSVLPGLSYTVFIYSYLLL